MIMWQKELMSKLMVRQTMEKNNVLCWCLDCFILMPAVSDYCIALIYIGIYESGKRAYHNIYELRKGFVKFIWLLQHMERIHGFNRKLGWGHYFLLLKSGPKLSWRLWKCCCVISRKEMMQQPQVIYALATDWMRFCIAKRHSWMNTDWMIPLKIYSVEFLSDNTQTSEIWKHVKICLKFIVPPISTVAEEDLPRLFLPVAVCPSLSTTTP